MVRREILDQNRDVLDTAAELFRQRIQSFFSNVDEVFALHPSPLTQVRTRALGVTLVIVAIIVIFFAVAFVFLIVLFLVGFLSKEDIGSDRPISILRVGLFWTKLAHAQMVRLTRLQTRVT